MAIAGEHSLWERQRVSRVNRSGGKAKPFCDLRSRESVWSCLVQSWYLADACCDCYDHKHRNTRACRDEELGVDRLGSFG